MPLRGLSRALPSAALALLLTTGLVATAALAPSQDRREASTSRVTTPALALSATTKRYSPKQGPLHNDPRNKKTKRTILRHINKAIHATRHGEKIRIMSWNVASRAFVRELLDANARGVSVRLLMAKGKAEAQPKSGDYWRLHRGLKVRSKTHPQPKGSHSWARTCDRSCRGKRGIAHSKSFVFSQVGTSKYVVMSTSANATEVSVNSQWNDMFTLVGNKKIYRMFLDVFRESTRDKVAHPGYRSAESRNVMGYVYPWKGKQATGDRAMKELKRIRCKGAQGTTGINGRTSIRIAQDAIIDQRGIDLAYKLRRMYNRGCNIKIVYALMGREVRRILLHTSRGAVPMRQIVQDFDGDGVYDRYLHSKVMSVSGVYDGDHRARVAWQGSENWSGLAKLSDEQGMRIERDRVQLHYTRWVDWLYTHPPSNPSATATTVARARAAGIDPYRKIKRNLS